MEAKSSRNKETFFNKYFSYIMGLVSGIVNFIIFPYIYILAILIGGEKGIYLIFNNTYAYLFIIIEIILFSVLFYLLVKISYSDKRKIKVTFWKLLVVSVITLIVANFISSYISQVSERTINPIETGTKDINLSEIINVKTRDSTISKELDFNGNKITWVEHTKMAPPYSYNQWDLFLYSFDDKLMKAELKQITDLSKSEKKDVSDQKIIGDKIYWIDDSKLYSIDSNSNIKLEKNGIEHIFGIYNGELIYAKKSTSLIRIGNGESSTFEEMEFDYSPFRESTIYSYDLTNQGKETALTDGTNTIIEGKYLCYVTKDENGKGTIINKFELDSRQTILFKSIADKISPDNFINIIACNEKYIAYSYTFYPENQGINNLLEVFDLDKNEYIFEKQIYHYNPDTQLIDDVIYYENKLQDGDVIGHKIILSENLLNGDQNKILDAYNLSGWKISGDYIAYIIDEGSQYSSNIYLKKFKNLPTS